MSILSRAAHRIASWIGNHNSVDELLGDAKWLLSKLETLAKAKVKEAQARVTDALKVNELAEIARKEAEHANKVIADLKGLYGIVDPEPELPTAANIAAPPATPTVTTTAPVTPVAPVAK